jgi:chloramphenicol 3-O-phosphotransferase
MPVEATTFLLTGPPAAGKSTVARLLAKRFSRGVHLEGDVFRRSVLAGRADMTPEPSREALDQLRLRYRLAALVADTYFSAGFTVVWEDVIAGPLLEECTELVRSRPLHVVVLLPTTQAIRERDSSRPDIGYAEWSVQQLHDVFASETPRLGHWLDTSDQSPDETVDEILRLTASV